MAVRLRRLWPRSARFVRSATTADRGRPPGSRLAALRRHRPGAARGLRGESTYNIVHLTLPDDEEESGPLFEHWVEEGVLRRDELPALWWIEQEFTGPDGVHRIREGIACSVKVEPYENRVVLPHERTHAGRRRAACACSGRCARSWSRSSSSTTRRPSRSAPARAGRARARSRRRRRQVETRALAHRRPGRDPGDAGGARPDAAPDRGRAPPLRDGDGLPPRGRLAEEPRTPSPCSSTSTRRGSRSSRRTGSSAHAGRGRGLARERRAARPAEARAPLNASHAQNAFVLYERGQAY